MTNCRSWSSRNRRLNLMSRIWESVHREGFLWNRIKNLMWTHPIKTLSPDLFRWRLCFLSSVELIFISIELLKKSWIWVRQPSSWFTIRHGLISGPIIGIHKIGYNGSSTSRNSSITVNEDICFIAVFRNEPVNFFEVRFQILIRAIMNLNLLMPSDISRVIIR